MLFARLVPVRIEPGSLEALKWLALLSMTVDHVNKYLLHGAHPWMFAFGRLAFPLFAFVLAYNLARPDALAQGVYGRTARRLAAFGLLACAPYFALNAVLGGAFWWPLNIMATLLLFTLIVWCFESGGIGLRAFALLLFLLGGAWAEFWWAGLVMCIAAWWYCRHLSPLSFAGWVAGVALLCVIGWALLRMPLVNPFLWSLLAVPVVWAAGCLPLSLPRLRWVFYVYYPAHLCVIWVLHHIRHF